MRRTLSGEGTNALFYHFFSNHLSDSVLYGAGRPDQAGPADRGGDFYPDQQAGISGVSAHQVISGDLSVRFWQGASTEADPVWGSLCPYHLCAGLGSGMPLCEGQAGCAHADTDDLPEQLCAVRAVDSGEYVS